MIRSDILFLQPSGVWKQIHLRGPNRSRKVESKATATRKIIPLCLAPYRPPWLLHLPSCIPSHSSAGPNLALSGGGEGTRSSGAAGREGGEEQGLGSQGRGTLRSRRAMVATPSPSWAPFQVRFWDPDWLWQLAADARGFPWQCTSAARSLLAPSSALCFSPSPRPPPQPSCFWSMLPWKIIIHEEFQMSPSPFSSAKSLLFNLIILVGLILDASLKPCPWARGKSLSWWSPPAGRVVGGCRRKLQPMGAQQGYGFEKCLHCSGGCDHFFFQGTASFGAWSMDMWRLSKQVMLEWKEEWEISERCLHWRLLFLKWS